MILRIASEVLLVLAGAAFVSRIGVFSIEDVPEDGESTSILGSVMLCL